MFNDISIWMKTTIWHNPKCSKSNATMKLLFENSIDLHVKYYLENPPTKQELEAVLAMLDMTAYELLRKSEPVLEGKNISADSPDLIELMLEHPELIERPIVINGDSARIGRPPEWVLGLFETLNAQPRSVNLYYNENPYGPSPDALEHVKNNLSDSAYYPQMIEHDLHCMISDRHQLENENVVLGSGATEILQSVLLAYGRKGTILTPWPTYTDPIMYAERLGINIKKTPLDKNLSIDLDAMLDAIDDTVSIVFICNPNNPTGLILDGNKLREFCKSVPDHIPVVIDEAYIEFSQDPEYNSMISLIHEAQNILVVRTFSKIYGMAGMRVGYGLGRTDIVSMVEQHKMSIMNHLSLHMAYHAYQDTKHTNECLKLITQGRQILSETFTDMGLNPLPSDSNFVYCDIGQDSQLLRTLLRGHNIFIMGKDQYIRVTVGTLSDIQRFSEVFRQVYKKDK